MKLHPKYRAKIKQNSLDYYSKKKKVDRATLPTPLPGSQTEFCNCNADIVLMGGGAGGGKTLGLLLDFAKPEYLRNSEYNGVIFRRTYPEIKNPGGILDESRKLYYSIAGQLIQNPLDWTFRSGAKIAFRHLQHEKTVYEYQGSQLNRLGFDELCHFSEESFFYLLSRNRSTSGIKPQVRATCNPDADSWVAKLVEWYVDGDGYPDRSKTGKIRWFIRRDRELIWADTPEELQNKYANSLPKSFTFIPALVKDNPVLMEKDPGYLANLMALHPVERARLLEGNWKIRYEQGKVFNRAWFEIIDKPPPGGFECRFWDMAATAKELNSKACYTAGVKMLRVGDFYCVTDFIAEQLDPTAGDNLIVATANQDGSACKVRWELEGGSAGLKVEANLQLRLHGYDAKGVKPLGDKLTRAKPFAAECCAGNVKLIRAPWNDRYLNWLHSFDGTSGQGKVNDAADASSGCYTELAATMIKFDYGVTRRKRASYGIRY